MLSRLQLLRGGLPFLAPLVLAGAGPALAETVARVATAGATEATSFYVVLPLRDSAGLDSLVKSQQDPTSPQFHHWLTPAEFNDRFGPAAGDVAKVKSSLTAMGLGVELQGRALHVTGAASQINAAFHTTLQSGATGSGLHRLFAATTLTMPDALKSTGATVLGLSPRVHEAHTMMRTVAVSSAKLADPNNRTSATGGYWYDDLRQAYQYPSYQTMITVNGKQQRLDGTGATIGILMSADVLDSDIAMIFNHENFKAHSGQNSNPTLYKRVAINGGSTTSSAAVGEASLDVQQALGGAPGSHVILYSIPDLGDNNIVAGYLKIVNDNQADVVSSSFGGCELAYTPAYNNGADDTSELRLEHEIFLQGNAQGISFLASSGDEAGLQCPTPSYAVNGAAGHFVASVAAPAADDAVTAVGGTNLVTTATSGSLSSAYDKENAYGDPEIPYDIYDVGALVSGGYWGPGGGVSQITAKPDYQTSAAINTGSSSYRALPDIGMQVGGCPGGEAVTPCNGGNSPLNGSGNTQRSYVIIAENGSYVGVIGTSVSSPEFSSVAALLVEKYGRMGNLNPYIYALGTAQGASGSNAPSRATTAFHRSIPGYNGVVSNNQPVAAKNSYFNYTVGNGTPIVTNFLGLPNATPAGVPQSASNP